MSIPAVPHWANISLLVLQVLISAAWGRTPERVLSALFVAAYFAFPHASRGVEILESAAIAAIYLPVAWRDERYAIFWTIPITLLDNVVSWVGWAMGPRLHWYGYFTAVNSLGYLATALVIVAALQARTARRTSAVAPRPALKATPR